MGHTDQIAAAADAIGVSGQRVGTDLQNGVRNRLLKCKFRVTLQITNGTGTGPTIRNRGSALATLDEVGLDEKGSDVMVMDGRVARFFSEINSPSALPATRLAVTTDQTITLEETFYLYCANPRIALPMETSYIEKNIAAKLKMFFRYNGDASRIITWAVAGTSAAVLTNPTMRVEQVYDDRRADRPFLLPYVRQLIADVPAASSAQRVLLEGSNYLGAIVVQQDTANVGEVSDIITSLVFRGDGYDIIGPNPIPFGDLVDHQAEQFGGSVTAARGYWCYNFLTEGKLSKLQHPASYTNLRFELNALPSVVSGAGASRVRVTFMEYRPDPDGVLTAPLPFAI